MKRFLFVAALVAPLFLSGPVFADHHEGEAANPCAAKNPCEATNPCDAKNPCNPCVAGKPAGEADNPCEAKNPCNPCAPKGQDESE